MNLLLTAFLSCCSFFVFSQAKTDTLIAKITCNCTSYSEIGTNTWKRSYPVSLQELTQVPPVSELRVNYVTDYDLEKDSLGRTSKMIRHNYYDKTEEEIIYSYDAQNRLVREDVHIDNGISGESTYLYREERVYFEYDQHGRRTSKVRKVIDGPSNEITIEECTYIYN